MEFVVFTKVFSSTGPSRSSSLWPAPTSGASVADTVAKLLLRTGADGVIVGAGVGAMDGGFPGIAGAEGATTVPGMQRCRGRQCGAPVGDGVVLSAPSSVSTVVPAPVVSAVAAVHGVMVAISPGV